MLEIEGYNFQDLFMLISLCIIFLLSIVISVLQFRKKNLPFGHREKLWRSLLIGFVTGIMGFSILLFFDILDKNGHWEISIYLISFVCAILPIQFFAAINAFSRMAFLNKMHLND